MSRPSRSTSPETRAPGTTSCMRLRARRKVDLPQPDGPMTAVTCLGSTVMLTSATAWAEPYQALSPSTSMRLAMAVPGSGKPVSAGEEAGDDGEDKHDHDKRQRSSPRPIDGHVEGRARFGEDEQGQPGLGAAEGVGADGIEPEGGQKERSGLAGHPCHRQDDAGREAGRGGGED